MPNTFVIDYRKLAREIIDINTALGVAPNQILFENAAGTTVVGSAQLNFTGTGLWVGDNFNTINAAFQGLNPMLVNISIDRATNAVDNTVFNNVPTNAGFCPEVVWRNARGTLVVPTVVVNGDFLGGYGWAGFDGAAMQDGAFMDAVVDGVPAAGSVPIGLEWYTGHSAATQIKRLGLSSAGSLIPENTVSATIGAVIINKMAGQCNIALGAQTVVVTNSLVTANSMVHATLASADATAAGVNSVVCGAGSFTIKTNAACAANCKVNFLVLA